MERKQLVVYEDDVKRAMNCCEDSPFWDVLSIIFGSQMIEELECKCGDRFEINGVWYLLAQFDSNKVALISLETGNRWTEPCSVKDSCHISRDEFYSISGGRDLCIVKRVPKEEL
jgi:hypothetical protein